MVVFFASWCSVCDHRVPLALAINNLRFVAPGLYVVICHLDGGATARAPFRVAEAPATL